MVVQHPLTRMFVQARVHEKDRELYEGEATMTQGQQDAYKTIIGDGLAKVTVGRDLSEKDYGTGGGVIVNVTLTCDQAETHVKQAIALAYQIADGACWYYLDQVKQQMNQKGLLRQ